MLSAKHFHHLNSHKFHNVKLPAKHGKSQKPHMKALKLLNLPNFKWLVSQFERIKMLKDETFHEFYIKNNKVSDVSH
jgi:hypothetical protein